MELKSLSQLYNKKEYNELKRVFLERDYYYLKLISDGDYVKIDLSKDDITVLQERVVAVAKDDENGMPIGPDETEIDIIEFNFFNHYLFPAIENYPNFFKRNLSKYIKQNHILGDSAKIDFYGEKKVELLEIVDYLQDASHLKPSILIDKSVKAAYLCIDYLNDLIVKIRNPYNKIPFKLNNENLNLLFALLYNSGYIDNKITIPELSIIMENSFLHGGTEELKRPSKYLYKYTGKNKKIPLKNKQELKEILFKIFS